MLMTPVLFSYIAIEHAALHSLKFLALDLDIAVICPLDFVPSFVNVTCLRTRRKWSSEKSVRYITYLSRLRFINAYHQTSKVSFTQGRHVDAVVLREFCAVLFLEISLAARMSVGQLLCACMQGDAELNCAKIGGILTTRSSLCASNAVVAALVEQKDNQTFARLRY